MTAPLQLKPEEVDELERNIDAIYPRDCFEELISDWRTLTAECDEMRKEIERLRERIEDMGNGDYP